MNKSDRRRMKEVNSDPLGRYVRKRRLGKVRNTSIRGNMGVTETVTQT